MSVTYLSTTGHCPITYAYALVMIKRSQIILMIIYLTPDTWGYCSRYDKGDMSSVSHLPEYYWSLPHYLCLGHDKEEPAYINSYCDRYNKRYICSVSHRSLPHHLFLSHNKEQSAITLDTYNPLSMPHAHPIHCSHPGTETVEGGEFINFNSYIA